MATIKLGAIVTDIRGKVGGNVFSRNKNGGYLKRTGLYPSSYSNGQSLQLSQRRETQLSWGTLSQVQKEEWGGYASYKTYVNKVGEVKHYTGYTLFVKTNGLLKLCGLPPVASPPTLKGIAPPTNAFANVTPDTTFFGGSGFQADAWYIFYQSRGLPPGRQSDVQDYYFAGAYLGSELNVSGGVEQRAPQRRPRTIGSGIIHPITYAVLPDGSFTEQIAVLRSQITLLYEYLFSIVNLRSSGFTLQAMTFSLTEDNPNQFLFEVWASAPVISNVDDNLNEHQLVHTEVVSGNILNRSVLSGYSAVYSSAGTVGWYISFFGVVKTLDGNHMYTTDKVVQQIVAL